MFLQLRTAAFSLIVRSWLEVPTFATRRLHACHHATSSSGASGNYAEMTISKPFRDLLHAVKLRHETDGFTSPLKEGMLRIFFALKIRRFRPGVNPRTLVPKASMLPLDHRSRSGSNEYLDAVKREGFIQWLCNYLLLKRNFVHVVS